MPGIVLKCRLSPVQYSDHAYLPTIIEIFGRKKANLQFFMDLNLVQLHSVLSLLAKLDVKIK